MFRAKINFIFPLVFIALLFSFVVSAQESSFELEREIDEILLKKDLSKAIEEAEKSPANDLKSLYKRLILYHRAVNFEKIAAVIRQISQTAREDKTGFAGGYTIKDILLDPLFHDAETLQIYLQNSFYLDEELFKKFTDICKKDKIACNVAGFDNWLAQKILENRNKEYVYQNLFDLRLQWRESFGLDNTDLLNQFAVDFRSNPENLDAALRYLSRFNNLQTVAEIAEKFASKQAGDYHVLGETLVSGVKYSAFDGKQARLEIGIGLLEKSLQTPFNERDKEIIWKYYLSKTSIPPVIGNYEKQLRFWTKTRLAESWREAGKSDKAQPIVEELAKLDKSDISVGDVSFLAGAVQSQTGARVVEKKILGEQENRKNTAAYWRERAEYYRGRNEPMLVLEAFYEGLKNVLFKVNETELWQERSWLVRGLANFTEDAFGKFAERAKGEDEKDLSDETKQKFALWKKTESFLRNEFQTTKSNPLYSYSLIQILNASDFDDLLNEIFNRHSTQIVKIYREVPADFLDMNLADDFLKNETVSAVKKDEFINQLFNIALVSEPDKSLKIIGYINEKRDDFAARSIPVLLKNLEQTEENLKRKNLSYNQREEFEYLADDYPPVLFSAYLKAKNWQGAEKFTREKYDWSKRSSYERHEVLQRLALAAAENGDYADAARLWKAHANLNRREIIALSALAKYPPVAENLREFYNQMKISEPYSPIPEMALRELSKDGKSIE
jgi:hypothetical protein